MTMALPADQLPGYRTMTLAEWDALGETEERYELVRGVLIMAASEMSTNRRIVINLAGRFAAVPGAEVMADMDVLVGPDPRRPTVRCPDLSVARGWPGDVPRLDPADLVLVVEVASTSSQEQDWVAKRDEYAAAGIPAYLVVDRHRGQVALFTGPENGTYAECQTGTALDVPLLSATVHVDLAQLLPGRPRGCG